MELLQLFQELLTKLANAEALLAAEKQASYDAGFAAGVQSVSGNDKVYSQAEFDTKLAEALAPVIAQVDGLKVEVLKASELVAKYDAAIQAEIEDVAKDTQRLEAFKASLGV